ncbi:MAG: CDP-alcohol phosphatidyltransferase family protein [Candidatus Poribacteria bacterium]|nr:CDP-alcohol phosphatidyltransferase family protein [Candidatus Poribacteria bacterium]
MTANAITLFRLFLTFTVIAIFRRHPYIDIACIVTILIIFILDSVDGIVARKHNQTSKFGAVFDIAADRIVENVFWIYFAFIIDFIPYWMPIVVVTRGILTDGIRGFALTDGKTPFEMMSAAWTRALTSSRFSRGLYGLAKTLVFIFLPIVDFLSRENTTLNIPFINTTVIDTFSLVSVITAYVAVAMCLIRGFPVLIDGWQYIKRST